jgi:hypothetical protein
MSFVADVLIRSTSTVSDWVIFFDFVTSLNCSQRQSDSIYLEFGNDFVAITHALLLHKLINYIFSSGYLNRFLSYISKSQSCIYIYSWYNFVTFIVLSGLPQGPCFFMNDSCDVTSHANSLRSNDDLEIHRDINSPTDYLHVQSDIVYMNGLRQIL